MSLIQMQKVMGGDGLGLYEPTGSWIGVNESGQVMFSRDGKNWWYDEFNEFEDSAYWPCLDPTTGNYLFLTFDIFAKSYQTANLGADPPTWDGVSGDPGDDGIGAAFWVACSSGGLFVALSTATLRHSNNGTDWTDHDSSLPANFGDFGNGHFRWSNTANLFIWLGSTWNDVGSEDQYWTSSNGLSWTARTFPMDWQSAAQGQNGDWFASSGAIDVVVMSTGQVYSSTDCINWTLRETTGFGCSGLHYNAGLDEFFFTTSQSGVNKLFSSTDGTAWNAKTLNDLADLMSGAPLITADPNTGLMIAIGSAPDFAWKSASNPYATSYDGVSWFARWGMGCDRPMHVPGKYGPPIDDTLTISVDPITITDGAVSSPTQSYAALYHNRDGRIQSRTSVAGYTNIGTWHQQGTEGLSWGGRQVRLDYVSGDAINRAGSEATGSWLTMYSADWGLITTGVEAKSGVFTLRYRDTETLVEDTNGGVTVTLTAEAT